jgi:hypothetical protein
LRDLAANVFRGQEGALLAKWSVGEHCFGYASEPIPGSENERRHRNAKPRKIYVVDQEEAIWVRRIFHWFVNERRTLRWIVRELNRLQAPKDHRSTTKGWRHQMLPNVLANRKYVGEWTWGQKMNVRNPLNGNIRQKDRAAEECRKWTRHFPHLRLIDDEMFAEAQRLLKLNEESCAANRNDNGKLRGSNTAMHERHPRHLFAGLVKCAHCGSTFHVGGSHSKYLFCPRYPMGTCPCQTKLRRDWLQRMVLGAIGDRILSNPQWLRRVFDETLKAWNANQAHIPSELEAAQKALLDVEQRITRLIDRIELGEGGAELDGRLAQRRTQKNELVEKIERLQRSHRDQPTPPTASSVQEALRRLRDVLAQGVPAAAHALRDLVGGEIVVTEIRQPGRQRHHLQGRFTVRSEALVRAALDADAKSAETTSSPGTVGEEIVIDFREPPQYEAESERAKALWDQDWLMIDIAKEIGKNKSYARKLIAFWFRSRDLPIPDGRSRRSHLDQKHQIPPMFEALADQVEAFLNEGLLIQEIAERSACCKDTVTKVIKYLRRVRGLSIPDGRTRRKELERKVSHPRRSPPGEGHFRDQPVL